MSPAHVEPVVERLGQTVKLRLVGSGASQTDGVLGQKGASL